MKIDIKIHCIFLCLVMIINVDLLAQPNTISKKYELSDKKGGKGKEGQQVPNSIYYSGKVICSESAQQQYINQTDTLSILVWNVEMWPHYSASFTELEYLKYWALINQWNSRKLNNKFDIILFQEIKLSDQDQNYEWLNSNYSMVHSSNYVIPEDSIRLGSAILSQYRIDSVIMQQTNTRSFFGFGMTKSASYAWLPIIKNKSTLLLVSVHGTNITNNRKFKKHMDQIIQTIKNHNGPAIVAGDFNTWNRTRLKYLHTEFEPLGFEVVESDNYKNGKRMAWGKHELDQVMLKGLKLVKNIEVGKQDSPSDHALLKFEIIFDNMKDL